MGKDSKSFSKDLDSLGTKSKSFPMESKSFLKDFHSLVKDFDSFSRSLSPLQGLGNSWERTSSTQGRTSSPSLGLSLLCFILNSWF